MTDFAIGVDLGGTNLRVAAVDSDGRVLERRQLPAEVRSGPTPVINALSDAVMELRERFAVGGAKLVGVGVGVPGIIFLSTGLLKKSPNLPGWEDIPVKEEIERRIGTKVYLENDANAAALGEAWAGAARNVRHLCLLTLGTGVGGGIIINGRILHGFAGMAAEVGHMTVEPQGALCGCGNHGCLEQYASATAIVRMAREAVAGERSEGLRALERENRLTSKRIYEAACGGDPMAKEIFVAMGRALGVGIATLINVLNPALVVLGGGVAAAWDAFAPAMFDELPRRCYIHREIPVRIERAQLGNDAGLVGAAYLAIQPG